MARVCNSCSITLHITLNERPSLREAGRAYGRQAVPAGASRRGASFLIIPPLLPTGGRPARGLVTSLREASLPYGRQAIPSGGGHSRDKVTKTPSSVSRQLVVQATARAGATAALGKASALRPAAQATALLN